MSFGCLSIRAVQAIRFLHRENPSHYIWYDELEVVFVVYCACTCFSAALGGLPRAVEKRMNDQVGELCARTSSHRGVSSAEASTSIRATQQIGRQDLLQDTREDDAVCTQ